MNKHLTLALAVSVYLFLLVIAYWVGTLELDYTDTGVHCINDCLEKE